MIRRVVFVAVPPVQMLDVVGPVEVFARCGGYRVELVSNRSRRLVRGSSGLVVGEAHHYRHLRGRVDTLLVAGGQGARTALGDRRLMEWLRATSGRVRRIGSVCTGAFLLAQAGLLDGRRAVTHWRWCRTLAQQHPAVAVEDDPIFIKDGHVYTSAGITAGIDLALALVEEDHGHRKATEIARDLVMFLRRPGGQSQFSSLLAAQTSSNRPIEDLQAWIPGHLRDRLDVETLAARCGMSPRHFTRVFSREKRLTPARFVERVRVESARTLLGDGGRGLKDIAMLVGFGSEMVMRRAFTRVLGVTAREYADRFRSR
jgi:transcriptional regulator GlxA family with amidase domain